MEYTYIHETDTIFEANGELHLISDEKTVVFNCEFLFNDLPFIIEKVLLLTEWMCVLFVK